jgi:stage V sporulation protein AC
MKGGKVMEQGNVGRQSQKNSGQSKQQTSSGQQDQEILAQQKQEYPKYVKQVTPTHNLGMQMLKAFITGGIICALGQLIINGGKMLFDWNQQTAGSWCSLIMVFLAALLTGLGIYPLITKWGGAGALVPITGFANSVCAPAIEYKKEGQVYGIGSKIFSIAGPVILYGVLVSWVLGIGYYIWKLVA